jgi:hypothetical protein
VIFTVSAIREWRRCRRRYRYAYVDLRRPAHDGKARLLGTAVHGALDAYWLGLPISFDFSNEFWMSDIGQIEQARARAMVQAYATRWVDESFNDVRSEAVFEFELGGHRVQGKLDKLVRSGGELVLVEHKTTSDDIATLGDDYWRRLPLDLQIAIYQEAVEAQTGERPGILYDVLKKPLGSPKQKDRKSKERESLAEFQARLTDTMLASPDEYLVRRVLHRTRDQQRELLAEAVEAMNEMAAARSYARNETACVSPYGACPYLGVCTNTDTLDSPLFVALENPHPELCVSSEAINQEESHGSSSLSEQCPI